MIIIINIIIINQSFIKKYLFIYTISISLNNYSLFIIYFIINK